VTHSGTLSFYALLPGGAGRWSDDQILDTVTALLLPGLRGAPDPG
jgi:hypothetical protein